MKEIIKKINKIMKYNGWYDFEIDKKYNNMILIEEGASYLNSYTYKVYTEYFKEKEKINVVNIEFEDIDNLKSIKNYDCFEIYNYSNYEIQNNYYTNGTNLNLYLPEKSEAYIIIDYFSEFAIAFGSDDFIEYFLENYHLSYYSYIEYMEDSGNNVFSKYKDRFIYRKDHNNIFYKYPYDLYYDKYDKKQSVEEVKENLRKKYFDFKDQILINESEVYFEFYYIFYRQELKSIKLINNKYIYYKALNGKYIYYSEVLCFFQNLSYESHSDYVQIIDIYNNREKFNNKKVYKISTIRYLLK